MKIHRFSIENFKVSHLVKIDKKTYPDLYNQMSLILRLSPGELVQIFDHSSSLKENYTYLIEGLDSKSISLMLKEQNINIIEQGVLKRGEAKRLNVYLSCIKKDKIELVVEKLTELGANSLHLLISERSQKSVAASFALNDSYLSRLKKISVEAAEQSGRGTILNIMRPINLEKALERLDKSSLNYVGIINEGKMSLDNSTSFELNTKKEINIFIGPEGGWTEKEEGAFYKRGFLNIQLGPSVLRAETAAIVAAVRLLAF